MGKYAYLNLTQKMIKIRKMVPKLLRKRYSEEVPYDFVRLLSTNSMSFTSSLIPYTFSPLLPV